MHTCYSKHSYYKNESQTKYQRNGNELERLKECRIVYIPISDNNALEINKLKRKLYREGKLVPVCDYPGFGNLIKCKWSDKIKEKCD